MHIVLAAALYSIPSAVERSHLADVCHYVRVLPCQIGACHLLNCVAPYRAVRCDACRHEVLKTLSPLVLFVWTVQWKRTGIQQRKNCQAVALSTQLDVHFGFVH